MDWKDYCRDVFATRSPQPLSPERANEIAVTTSTLGEKKVKQNQPDKLLGRPPKPPRKSHSAKKPVQDHTHKRPLSDSAHHPYRLSKVPERGVNRTKSMEGRPSLKSTQEVLDAYAQIMAEFDAAESRHERIEWPSYGKKSTASLLF